MKGAFRLSILLTLALAAGAQASEQANPLFGYTHLLPSPFTLPAGRLVLGTSAAFGVTDFLQVGTDVFRDLYQVYNANVKVGLLDYPGFAMAVTGSYLSYNTKDVVVGAADQKVESIQPGAVLAFELMRHVALFTGGNLSFNRTDVPGGLTSGYFQGAQVNADLSFAYDPPAKGRRVGNVLSAGISYDFNYELYGFGLSHHWPGYHVGFHFYPNADTNRLVPILTGGMAVEL